jgi:hypothetical protein
MQKMPLVTESRLKGNYGAALVMSRLSGECLVRPVAADTDVGVDLYCESVAENRPFLHFWLQVKAGEQCKRDTSHNAASCIFELDHLKYWARQPVPVFAALVPVEWPVLSEPDIYIVDITSQFLLGTFPESQNALTLWSYHQWPAGDRTSVQEFLRYDVPDTTARLQVSRGMVADTPTPTPQYVQTRPGVPVLRFQDEIRYQLRRTAANAIIFALADGEPSSQDSEFRRLMAQIVEQFGDDPHWENFFSRALSSHADKKYSEAVPMYEKARDCIQADANVRDKTEWQERVRLLESLREQVDARRPLRNEELRGEYSGS